MDIFEQLSSQLDLNDPRQKTISLMKGIVLSIPDKKGQAFALAKILNNPKFGLDKPEAFPGVDKDAWSLKHLEDYTPPDVESKERSEDEKAFWNWDSDRHWTKRGTEEMKRKARDYGYVVGDEPVYESKGYQKFLNEVGKAQTAKDRQKIFDENAMPGSRILYPRMSEKVLKGEDIDMVKDFGLDMLEQGMYAGNPAERLLGFFKAPAMVTKWGGAVANPLAMESLDAAAYHGEDTDRANFSPIDVVVGAGVNRGMDRLTYPLFKNLSRDTKNYIDSKAFARDRQALDKLKTMADEAEKSGNVELSNILNKKTLDKLTEIVEKGKPKEKIKDSFTNRYIRQLATKDLANDAAAFTSNKTGDLLSEDPKRTKRLLRSAVGPGGVMAMPLINDVVDAYYESDEKNKEKKKIDDLIYGLQGGR